MEIGDVFPTPLASGQRMGCRAGEAYTGIDYTERGRKAERIGIMTARILTRYRISIDDELRGEEEKGEASNAHRNIVEMKITQS
jgi:MOSC domain-containing protein YiiM